ncbi:hypothetical protein K457DRAFT_1871299 [Linnemannia elongata AG-77]|uniref:Uncharacterized protein n=1 Tax=Linnemannia elongata AG-77 TaxID=1314771 RepID=A0A197KDW9_9FUNG|nr:hypothetical protein K457DRAFT_1871299 [Linnemannia elongata AG-77]
MTWASFLPFRREEETTVGRISESEGCPVSQNPPYPTEPQALQQLTRIPPPPAQSLEVDIHSS